MCICMVVNKITEVSYIYIFFSVFKLGFIYSPRFYFRTSNEGKRGREIP